MLILGQLRATTRLCIRVNRRYHIPVRGYRPFPPSPSEQFMRLVWERVRYRSDGNKRSTSDGVWTLVNASLLGNLYYLTTRQRRQAEERARLNYMFDRIREIDSKYSFNDPSNPVDFVNYLLAVSSAIWDIPQGESVWREIIYLMTEIPEFAIRMRTNLEMFHDIIQSGDNGHSRRSKAHTLLWDIWVYIIEVEKYIKRRKSSSEHPIDSYYIIG